MNCGLQKSPAGNGWAFLCCIILLRCVALPGGWRSNKQARSRKRYFAKNACNEAIFDSASAAF